MIKRFRFGDTWRKVHCFTECPEEAGVQMKTVVDSVLKQLNKLLDETYDIYRTKFPKVTRPVLYVYICEDKVDEINAFTDGTDIYLAAAAMIGMYSYIKERLDTEKINGGKVIPAGLEYSSEIRIYKNILELIVAHELVHIWHRHRLWKQLVLQVATSAPAYCSDNVFSEYVQIEDVLLEDLDENVPERLSNLTSVNGKLVLENTVDRNYIQQILEMDADCRAVCIVLMQIQREIDGVAKAHTTGNPTIDRDNIRMIMHYHSYVLGLLVGAAGLMCGFLDNQRVGKPFDRLSDLLHSDHPVPAIRFFKMHTTLLETVHHFFTEESVVNVLLSQTSTFAIDIFMHDGTSMDMRNCFWAPAQTREAQEFIVLLERGWNMIHDSLQQCSLVEIPNKHAEEDLTVYESMIWYDKYGNNLRV